MNEFSKGILSGVVLYVLAVISVISIHQLIDFNENAQGPPPSFMTFLFFVLLGIYRLFKCIYLTIRYIGQERIKGELMVHLIVFGFLLVSFAYSNFFNWLSLSR